MELIPGLVSVVIPAYNRAAMLPRCVASCLEQTYPQVEAIVVDDGSADDTPQVLAGLAAKHGSQRLRWVRQENAGSAAARNHGMDLAQGEFLQFLDSDDLLDRTKFALQVAALREDEEADLAVCDYQCVYDGAWDEPFERVRNDGDLHRKLAAFWQGIIWVATPLIRRERIPPALRWNGRVVPTDDTDFLFRLMLGVRKWCYTPGILCTWIHHQGDRLTTRGPEARYYYWELVDSVYQYWRVARESIPQENRWMIPCWADAILREKARHSRDRGLLRRCATLAIARPWDAGVFRLAIRMGVKSLLPWGLLDRIAARRGKAAE